MNHRTTVVLLILFFTGLIVLWWADYAGVPTEQNSGGRWRAGSCPR